MPCATATGVISTRGEKLEAKRRLLVTSHDAVSVRFTLNLCSFFIYSRFDISITGQIREESRPSLYTSLFIIIIIIIYYLL